MKRPAEPSRRRILAAGTGLLAAGALSSVGVALPRVAESGEAEADADPAPPPRMPLACVGHGSPMAGIEPHKSAPWVAWGETVPRPRCVLVVSAHFERAPITIGSTQTLPLIYDFGGFPRPLYELRYPAPGAPRLAARVEKLLTPLGDVRRDELRGHDHGAWIPLRSFLPQANVPVLSLSLPTEDPKRLFDIGRSLRPLRDEGVWILASGNLTHNLRGRAPRDDAAPFAYAVEFDRWIAESLAANRVDEILDWERKAPAARRNHPTVEHFVPLLLALGARHDDDVVRFPVEGFELGSLSRRSVEFAAPQAPR